MRIFKIIFVSAFFVPIGICYGQNSSNSNSPIVLNIGSENGVVSAEATKGPPHCVKKNQRCLNALERYNDAVSTLENAIQKYQQALRTKFKTTEDLSPFLALADVSAVLTNFSTQLKEIREEVTALHGVKGKITDINDALNSLASIKYLPPSEKAENRNPDKFYKAIHDAHSTINKVANLEARFERLRQFHNVFTDLGSSLQKKTNKLNDKSPVWTLLVSIRKMSNNLEMDRENIIAAYETFAKTKSEVMRAGVSFEKTSSTLSLGEEIIIEGAVYGDQKDLSTIKNYAHFKRLRFSKTRCDAKGYFHLECNYNKKVVKRCVSEGVSIPKAPNSSCQAGTTEIDEIIYAKRHATANICEVKIDHRLICGGHNPAPYSHGRIAKVFYRCKAGATVRSLTANDQEIMYLNCLK